MRLWLMLTLLCVCFGFISPCSGDERNKGKDLNAVVLEHARKIPEGGGYQKAWTGSGTPHEIRFGDGKVLSKGEGGTYCCGVTFAVVMSVAHAQGLLRDKSLADIKQFQKNWYGVGKPSQERTCVHALEQLGIGRAVRFEDAQPGDFVQFWRSKSGHSVIFLAWIEEDGQRVGLRYRSSQTATNGVGDHQEYFKTAPGDRGHIDPERTYFGRLTGK